MMTSTRSWRTPTLGVLLLATWAGVIGSAAAAGPYDGSRPLLCAVVAAVECDSSGGCERQLPDGENTPRFIRVDVAGQAITSGAKRSVLRSVAHIDGELILQGGENARGWSATIDEATGRMAVAVVDNDHTFSLFGACTVP
jgi:hypothetical protein